MHAKLSKALRVFAAIAAVWLACTLITLLLCHLGWLGFAMGITIATGAPNPTWTFGLYGIIYAIPAIYWFAAWCGDNL